MADGTRLTCPSSTIASQLSRTADLLNPMNKQAVTSVPKVAQHQSMVTFHIQYLVAPADQQPSSLRGELGGRHWQVAVSRARSVSSWNCVTVPSRPARPSHESARSAPCRPNWPIGRRAIHGVRQLTVSAPHLSRPSPAGPTDITRLRRLSSGQIPI